MKTAMLSLAMGLSVLGLGCSQHPALPPPPVDPELKRYVLDDVPTDIPHKTFVDFDGKVHLVGYAISPEGEAKPGTRVTVTLYWKSVAPLRGGWQLFTHVIDALAPREHSVLNLDNQGPLREQATIDGRQIQKLAPAFWQPGHVYVDEQSFEIPNDAHSPELTFSVGIWQDGAWMRRPDSEQEPELPSARLDVLSGPSDGDNRAIVAHIPTGVVPEKPTGVVPEKPTGVVPEKPTGVVPEKKAGQRAN